MINSSNIKNIESKDKFQSQINNSLSQNIILQNQLNNKNNNNNSSLEKEMRLNNLSLANQNLNLSNLINCNNPMSQSHSNNQILSNMLHVNGNPLMNQNSINSLQNNLSSPSINLKSTTSGSQNQQIDLIEKMLSQKNNLNNNNNNQQEINKLNLQQRLNYMPDLNTISIVSPNGLLATKQLNLMNNIFNKNPNLNQNLLGINSLPLNLGNVNNLNNINIHQNNLNNIQSQNSLLQQQQQNMQILNMNNQLLPLQSNNVCYLNNLGQPMVNNMDLINKLQVGGVNCLNNIPQGLNGIINTNPQLGLMNGMNLNQRILMESKKEFNLI